MLTFDLKQSHALHGLATSLVETENFLLKVL